MWTPPGGQVRLQTESVAAWSGSVICPASWCSPRWRRARMVFVRIGIQIDEAGSKALERLGCWLTDPVF